MRNVTGPVCCAVELDKSGRDIYVLCTVGDVKFGVPCEMRYSADYRDCCALRDVLWTVMIALPSEVFYSVDCDEC